MVERKSVPGAPNRWGVLLLAHGAPDKLEDIPAFLLNVRGGRPLPEAAVAEITGRYRRIGGGSPLLRVTNRQASALSEELNRSRALQGLPPLPVYVGMRNWKPFIAESVVGLAEAGVERVAAVCLAPQNSRTSVGLYHARTLEAVEKFAPHLKVEFVESWHDNASLIAAFQEKISQALERARQAAGAAVPVIFTAHSVPEKTIAAGDPYQAQVKETASLVAETLALSGWTVAFQSQGMSAGPWIGPTVESKIDELAAQGHRHALIAPTGFVSDHVEILYDIDVAFREYGKARGVTVWRSESLNDSPLFISALASVVRSRVSE
jgi:ferrochelatase